MIEIQKNHHLAAFKKKKKTKQKKTALLETGTYILYDGTGIMQL